MCIPSTSLDRLPHRLFSVVALLNVCKAMTMWPSRSSSYKISQPEFGFGRVIPCQLVSLVVWMSTMSISITGRIYAGLKMTLPIPVRFTGIANWRRWKGVFKPTGVCRIVHMGRTGHSTMPADAADLIQLKNRIDSLMHQSCRSRCTNYLREQILAGAPVEKPNSR